MAQTQALASLQHYRGKLADQETKVRHLTGKQELIEKEYTVSKVL